MWKEHISWFSNKDLTIYFPYNTHKHIVEYFSTRMGPEKTHKEINFKLSFTSIQKKLSHMLIIRLVFIFINILIFKNIMINHNISKQKYFLREQNIWLKLLNYLIVKWLNHSMYVYTCKKFLLRHVQTIFFTMK